MGKPVIDLLSDLDIIQRHQAGGFPVDCVSLAEELGISVYSVEGWDDEARARSCPAKRAEAATLSL